MSDTDDDPVTDCAPGSGAASSSGQGNRPLKERVELAKEAARAARVKLGLPADGDDGAFTEQVMAARRKGARKRRHR